jgi:hypothetical protein
LPLLYGFLPKVKIQYGNFAHKITVTGATGLAFHSQTSMFAHFRPPVPPFGGIKRGTFAF